MVLAIEVRVPLRKRRALLCFQTPARFPNMPLEAFLRLFHLECANKAAATASAVPRKNFADLPLLDLCRRERTAFHAACFCGERGMTKTWTSEQKAKRLRTKLIKQMTMKDSGRTWLAVRTKTILHGHGGCAMKH